MPRIATHAIPLELVREASKPMIDELQSLLKIPREHFEIEVFQNPFVRDGDPAAGHPFVEVSLFDRGTNIEDHVARAITRHFQAVGCPNLDVYLISLERRRYYEDGEPF